MAAKRRCKGKTKKGRRCQAHPLKDTDFCLAHSDADTRASVGFTPEAGAQGGRPRKPRPDEVLRERIEADLEKWLAPLEAALGAGKPVVTWDAAEGKHSIQYVPDPALGMKAYKLAFERVYGKPRQQIELTGEDGGAVKTEIEFSDPKVREAMHDLVSAVADAREGESGGSGSGSR